LWATTPDNGIRSVFPAACNSSVLPLYGVFAYNTNSKPLKNRHVLWLWATTPDNGIRSVFPAVCNTSVVLLYGVFDYNTNLKSVEKSARIVVVGDNARQQHTLGVPCRL
jgi:hypothetical protein